MIMGSGQTVDGFQLTAEARGLPGRVRRRRGRLTI
jgi:hypothetical protein